MGCISDNDLKCLNKFYNQQTKSDIQTTDCDKLEPHLKKSGRSSKVKTADKSFEEDVVNFYRGKDVQVADKLLRDTAHYNFEAGVDVGKNREMIRILKLLKRWDVGYFPNIPTFKRIYIKRAIGKLAKQIQEIK
jgi:hypothetical protein